MEVQEVNDKDWEQINKVLDMLNPVIRTKKRLLPIASHYDAIHVVNLKHYGYMLAEEYNWFLDKVHCAVYDDKDAFNEIPRTIWNQHERYLSELAVCWDDCKKANPTMDETWKRYHKFCFFPDSRSLSKQEKQAFRYLNKVINKELNICRRRYIIASLVKLLTYFILFASAAYCAFVTEWFNATLFVVLCIAITVFFEYRNFKDIEETERISNIQER